MKILILLTRLFLAIFHIFCGCAMLVFIWLASWGVEDRSYFPLFVAWLLGFAVAGFGFGISAVFQEKSRWYAFAFAVPFASLLPMMVATPNHPFSIEPLLFWGAVTFTAFASSLLSRSLVLRLVNAITKRPTLY